jgi:quinoprotein glucose dehydrogenase
MGDLKDGSANKVLAGLLDDLLANKVPAALQLEVLEAAALRKDKTVAAKLAKFEASRPTPAENFFALEPYLETLEGGDVAKGKKSFFENVAISCARCHQVGNQGGEVGPRLDGIGAKVDRKHLLESIVNPGAQIAEGFDFFLVTLKNGKAVAGITRKETKTELTLISPEDGLVTINKSDIKTKQKGPSGMPPGLQAVISKRELRDVIEYLASLKQAPK